MVRVSMSEMRLDHRCIYTSCRGIAVKCLEAGRVYQSKGVHLDGEHRSGLRYFVWILQFVL